MICSFTLYLWHKVIRFITFLVLPFLSSSWHWMNDATPRDRRWWNHKQSNSIWWTGGGRLGPLIRAHNSAPMPYVVSVQRADQPMPEWSTGPISSLTEQEHTPFDKPACQYQVVAPGRITFCITVLLTLKNCFCIFWRLLIKLQSVSHVQLAWLPFRKRVVFFYGVSLSQGRPCASSFPSVAIMPSSNG